MKLSFVAYNFSTTRSSLWHGNRGTGNSAGLAYYNDGPDYCENVLHAKLSDDYCPWWGTSSIIHW